MSIFIRLIAGHEGERHHGPMLDDPTIAQMKITIIGIEPPVWRRLLVPRKTTLADLHHIIQAAFGWLDYHLHEFVVGGLRFGDAELLNEDSFDESQHALPAEQVRLFEFGYSSPPFIYHYDFGDDWQHLIEIEEQVLPDPGRKYPACIGGERSRPPEDVGGVHGYAAFLAAFNDRRHPEYADMRRWAGRGFDPEKFDLAKTDRAVRSAVRSARRRATLEVFEH